MITLPCASRLLLSSCLVDKPAHAVGTPWTPRLDQTWPRHAGLVGGSGRRHAIVPCWLATLLAPAHLAVGALGTRRPTVYGRLSLAGIRRSELTRRHPPGRDARRALSLTVHTRTPRSCVRGFPGGGGGSVGDGSPTRVLGSRCIQATR